jgi:hypothetical protein
MNRQWLKRSVPLFMTLCWAFALPVCELHAQDKDAGKKAAAEKEPTKAAKPPVHDDTHGHADKGFLDLIAENRLAIQIGAGVVLIAGIGIFIYLRMSKRPKNDPPPAPGEPPSPK